MDIDTLPPRDTHTETVDRPTLDNDAPGRTTTDIPAGNSGPVAFTREDDPDLIRNEWMALEKLTGGAFSTYRWFDCWMKTGGAARGDRPALIVARDTSGRAVALFPLVIIENRGARVLTTPGEFHASCHEPLVDPAFARTTARPLDWSPAWALFDDVDTISLDGAPRGSDVFDALSTTAYGWSVHRLDLAEDWDSLYASKFGKRSRSSNQRKERRLADTGKTEIVMVDGGPESAALVDEIIDLKSQWLIDTNRADVFAEPGVREFYRSLMITPADNGSARPLVAGLYLDGQLLAGHLGLTHRGTFHSMVLWTTDGEERRFSPGAMLLRRLIRETCERRLETFDFGAGDQPYKLEFADRSMPIGHAVRACTLRGLPHASLQFAGVYAKRHARTAKAGMTDALARARRAIAKPR